MRRSTDVVDPSEDYRSWSDRSMPGGAGNVYFPNLHTIFNNNRAMHDGHEHGASRNCTGPAADHHHEKKPATIHNHSNDEDVNLAAGEYIKKKHQMLMQQT
ncbi:hypothetical protein ACLOJK_008323 [Asimina triloba]